MLTEIPACMGNLEDATPFRECTAKWGPPAAVYPYFSWENKNAVGLYTVHWATRQGKIVRPFGVEGNLKRGLLRWVCGFPDSNRPLFNWPALFEDGSTDKKVLVVEGEKTAVAAMRLFPMWVVVTSSGGANSASHTHWPLAGRDVVIACDYDEPGLRYGDQVAALLRDAGASAVTEMRWGPLLNWKPQDGILTPRNGEIPLGYDLDDLEKEGWTLELIESAGASEGGWCAPYPLSEEDASSEEEDNSEFPDEGETKPYMTVSAGELIQSDLPDRDYLLGTWLIGSSSNMIFAPRGIGKSFLALNIGLAVAQGKSFLNWKSYKRADVLYVDGEMPMIAWKERLRILGIGPQVPYIENLRFITYDALVEEEGRRVPDIGTPHDRHRICASLLPTTRLLILDNISCLMTGVDENDSLSWEPIAEWVEYLKHQYKLAILFVHHAGKSGQQRGISKREDAMDTVISLKHPSDYEPSDGARFDIEFSKGRTVSPSEAHGLQVHLKEGKWLTKSADTERANAIHEMYEGGASAEQMSRTLGISVRQIYRLVADQVEMKILKPRKGFK